MSGRFFGLPWLLLLAPGFVFGELPPPLPPELHQIIVEVGEIADPVAQDPAQDIGVWERKFSAVQKASRLGPNVWPAVPELITLTGSPSIQVSVAAATILASVHADQHPQWNDLKERLRSTKNAYTGFEYLIRGRDEGSRVYSEQRRKFAINALETIGPSARPAHRTLLRVLESEEELNLALWCDAASALSTMQVDPELYLPQLWARLTNRDGSLAVRSAAADALACARTTDAETMKVLRGGLDDSYAQVRVAAVRALVRLGVPVREVQATLSALLKHKLPSIRANTLRVLAELGHRGEPFREEIRRLLDDPSPPVSQAAAQAHDSLPQP